ncbi:FHA domain-containing protein [Marisediminicola sp. LYQ134]|uniref:FHA domain-containing protein n=1 Tax=Marisediminicola sp. LYQ134 TaxID=3391061 RepID=UPI003983CD46
MRPADFDDDTVLVPRAPGTERGTGAPAEFDEDTVTRPAVAPVSTAVPVPSPLPLPPVVPVPRSATRVPRGGIDDSRAPIAAYRWSLNDGPARSLDRPVLVGRAPRLPRVVDDVVPVLETVTSPGKLVSSTHVRLERQGASVVVTDLRSTNGTLVTSPGAVRVALGPGDSIVAVPGTLIDIGDENVIEILPMERVRPSDPPLERLFP